MTDLSPTPLTPRCKECGTALELPGVAAELERLERSLAERDTEAASLKQKLGEALAGCENVSGQLAAAEARNATLVRALKAAPCGQDGFDNPTWDCGEVHCLRCAALTEQQQEGGS